MEVATMDKEPIKKSFIDIALAYNLGNFLRHLVLPEGISIGITIFQIELACIKFEGEPK